VNKKVKRLARKSALSIKAKQNSILIIEDFHLDSPKTLAYNEVLKALDLINEKSLLVLGKPNINVYLSSRNLRHSNVITNSEINTYNIVNASTLVLFESAIAGIETILNKV
jgi:large subunit ribosomal protein L4